MRKNEFLDILKQSLTGEISPGSIKSNIEYYDQYIGIHSLDEEERIISELGDPRLIAKTIIEAERIAKEKNFSDNHSQQNNYYNSNEETEDKHNRAKNERPIFFSNVKWYHKVIIFFVILLIIAVFIILGRILISLLFVFGLPIIILLLLFALFKRR